MAMGTALGQTIVGKLVRLVVPFKDSAVRRSVVWSLWIPFIRLVPVGTMQVHVCDEE